MASKPKQSENAETQDANAHSEQANAQSQEANAQSQQQLEPETQPEAEVDGAELVDSAVDYFLDEDAVRRGTFYPGLPSGKITRAEHEALLESSGPYRALQEHKDRELAAAAEAAKATAEISASSSSGSSFSSSSTSSDVQSNTAEQA